MRWLNVTFSEMFTEWKKASNLVLGIYTMKTPEYSWFIYCNYDFYGHEKALKSHNIDLLIPKVTMGTTLEFYGKLLPPSRSIFHKVPRDSSNQ